MGQLRSCEFCGRLFQSLGTGICPACCEKLDEAFIKVREYLYDNPEHVDISDILENTGIPEKALRFLLKEGRVSRKVFNMESAVKCAVCGTAITWGRLCGECLAAWNAGIKALKPEPVGNKPVTQQKPVERMHTMNNDYLYGEAKGRKQ